jgi:hypothetical protein
LAEVHVDQSHCNYHLRQALIARGWDLLFRDAPSASRGGGGTQGEILAIVESHAWPIPDLVLTRDADLLIVEIDAQFQQAAGSFVRYRAADGAFRDAVSPAAGRRLRRMLLAFCRSVRTPDPALYFEAEQRQPVDLLVAFGMPGVPVFSQPLV